MKTTKKDASDPFDNSTIETADILINSMKEAKKNQHELQTTQPTSGAAVTANKNCCANGVKPSRPSNGSPIYRFLGMPAMRTRWMAGAAAHKSG